MDAGRTCRARGGRAVDRLAADPPGKAHHPVPPCAPCGPDRRQGRRRHGRVEQAHRYRARMGHARHRPAARAPVPRGQPRLHRHRHRLPGEHAGHAQCHQAARAAGRVHGVRSPGGRVRSVPRAGFGGHFRGQALRGAPASRDDRLSLQRGDLQGKGRAHSRNLRGRDRGREEAHLHPGRRHPGLRFRHRRHELPQRDRHGACLGRRLHHAGFPSGCQRAADAARGADHA